MESYHNILFDLDGTLTDPALGITGGVLYALEQAGIQEEDREKLCAFIGPPLMESFHKYYGFTAEQSEKAAECFREYYERQGKLENEVYEGIHELLHRLKSEGRVLAVATSKGEEFAMDILEHFKLKTYFDYVVGQEVDGLTIKKSLIVGQILKKGQITDLAHTVLVGDRAQDMIAAAESGIHSIGVLYGYGSREELEQAGAEKTAASIKELEQLLLKKERENE